MSLFTHTPVAVLSDPILPLPQALASIAPGDGVIAQHPEPPEPGANDTAPSTAPEQGATPPLSRGAPLHTGRHCAHRANANVSRACTDHDSYSPQQLITTFFSPGGSSEPGANDTAPSTAPEQGATPPLSRGAPLHTGRHRAHRVNANVSRARTDHASYPPQQNTTAPPSGGSDLIAQRATTWDCAEHQTISGSPVPALPAQAPGGRSSALGNSSPRSLLAETILADEANACKAGMSAALLFGYADLDSGALRQELVNLARSEKPPSLVLAIGISLQDAEPLALVRTADGAVPCALIATAHRSTAVEAAVRAMRAAGHNCSVTSAFLVSDLAPDELCALRVRIVAIPSSGPKGEPEASASASHANADVRALMASLDTSNNKTLWLPLSQLPSSSIAHIVAITGAHVASFSAPITAGDALPLGEIFRGAGATSIGAVAQPLTQPNSDHAAFETRREYADQANRALASALRACAGTSEDAVYLRSWADRVSLVPWAEVPEMLRGASQEHDPGRAASRPFFVRYRPCVTKPNPRPPPQRQIDPSFKPRALADLLQDWALDKLENWFSDAVADLNRMLDDVKHGRTTHRRFNTTCVIGQSGFREQARGVIWDNRGDELKVLDFDAPIVSHLNIPKIEAALEHFPDRALVSNITQGVTYGGTLDLQIVLSPHLISMPEGATDTDAELRRINGLGWTGFFDKLPFLPIRLLAQGSQAKPGKAARRTTDGGGPRGLYFDEEGRVVHSINTSVALRSDEIDLAPQLREALSCDIESSEIAAQIENDSLLAHSLGAVDPSSVAPASSDASQIESDNLFAQDLDALQRSSAAPPTSSPDVALESRIAQFWQSGGIIGAIEDPQEAGDTTGAGVIARDARLGTSLEDCAGIAAASVALVREGFGSARTNDKDRVARYVARLRLGIDALTDAEMQEPPWQTLSPPQKRSVTTLVGGYPCQSVSTVNTDRRGAEDPQSLLCLQGLRVLADDDFNIHGRGSLSMILAEAPPNKELQYPELGAKEASWAAARGYARNILLLRSHDYGDPQSRSRAIALFEPNDFVAQAGPPSPATLRACTSFLCDIVEDHAVRPPHLIINASTFQHDPGPPPRDGAPPRQGWVSFEGDNFPVWSDSGHALTVKASGRPPKYSGGALYQCCKTGIIYALSARECWILQGLPAILYEQLHGWLDRQHMNTDIILRRLAGNAISAGVASAMAEIAKERRYHYLAWEATRRPSPSLASDEMFDIEAAEMTCHDVQWERTTTLNMDIDIAAQPRSPPEDKPHAGDLVHDWSVLNCSASIWGEPIFGHTDDIACYFNQLCTNPTEFWKTCLYWADLTDNGGEFTIVAEYCVGFGISSSSNIAQRLAWALLWVLGRRFDAEENLLFDAESDPARLAYIKTRRALSSKTGQNECRLYATRF